MARKKKPEEHVNHERWLVSYADFITLLFAFFVVMYSVSAVNEGKFRVLSEALAAAFRSSPKSLQPIQVGKIAKSPEIQKSKYPGKAPNTAIIVSTNKAINLQKPTDLPQSEIRTDGGRQGQTPESGVGGAAWDAAGKGAAGVRRNLAQMAGEIEESLGALIADDLILVRRDKGNFWIEVEIKSSILFDSGSAELWPAAIPVMGKIAGVLRNYSYPIQVGGFTDNVPINTSAYPSNWELSAARAASVVHLFMDTGVEPERMAAVGYGEYHPVADNTTVEGRQKNRRVVLLILAETGQQRGIGKQPQGTAEVSSAQDGDVVQAGGTGAVVSETARITAGVPLGREGGN